MFCRPEEERTCADLFRKAHDVRIKNMGPGVHLRGIIEFSNYCRQDCLFCGLRRSNTRLRRYRMTPDEIIDTARKIMGVHPFGTIVLQSGEDPGYPAQDISRVIKEIKNMGAAVTLSLGQRMREEYALWKEHGADRYLLKFETSDPVLFRKMKPTTTLEERLTCIRNLQELGYQVGSGIILGLPGQTVKSVMDDVRLMRELDLEMVSIGPFIPHPDTPLSYMADEKNAWAQWILGGFPSWNGGGTEKQGKGPSFKQELILATLKMIALCRMAVPQAHMPGTTALGVMSKGLDLSEFWPLVPKMKETGQEVPSSDSLDARGLALLVGANVIMPDLTPKEYRDSYEIYPGKSSPHWEMIEAVRSAKDLIASVGMEVASGRGDSPKDKWSKPEAKHH